MNDNPLMKILSILGFVVFAAYSCWATTESLYMLSDSLPKFIWWAISIGFFILASYGTKLIIDSLNTRVYVEDREIKLIGGFIIVLLFWLLMSMPTNTHTFFYRNAGKDVISQDLTTTAVYVNQIREQKALSQQAKNEANIFEEQATDIMVNMCHEICDVNNLGWGPKARVLRDKLSSFLGLELNMPHEPTPRTYSVYSDWCQRTIIPYVNSIIARKANDIRNRYKKLSPADVAKVKENSENLDRCKSGIEDMIKDNAFPNWEITAKVNPTLKTGYDFIKQYSEYVEFKGNDENHYLNAKTSRSESLNNIVWVWSDFIKGEYKGRGFIYWVLLSILVDLAAFMFFDLAFKKKEF